MCEERIVCDPKILAGKPVIKGTRISVELVLEALAYGESFDQILAEYPFLTKEDLQAAVLFAMESLKAETVYPLASA